MAVTETLQLQGVAEFAGGLQQAAGAVDVMTSAQKRQTTARKKLTEAEKAARAVARERRRQRREAIKEEKQRKRSIKEVAQAIVGYSSAMQVALGVSKAVIGSVREMVFGFAQVNNENAKLARGVGVTAGELAEMQFLLDRVTRGGVQADRVLGQLASKAFQASQGSGEAAAAFERLGVQVDDGNGGVKDAVTLLEEVRAAFSTTVPEAERLGVASRIFGEDQARLVLPALTATNQTMAASSERFRSLNGDMLAATRAAEAQEDRIGELQLAYTGLSQVVGQTTSPAIQAVTSELASFTAGVTSALREVLGFQQAAANDSGIVARLSAQERAQAALNNALGAQSEILERQAAGDVRAGDVQALAALDAQLPALRQRIRSLEETADKERQLADAQRIKLQVTADENVRRAEAERLVRATTAAVQGLGQTEAQVAAQRLADDIRQLELARDLDIISAEDAARRIERLRKEAAAQADLTGRKEAEAEAVMAALEGVGVKEEELHRQRIQRMQELFAQAVALGELSKEEAAARLQRFSEDSTAAVETAATTSELTVQDAVASMDSLVGAVGQLSTALGGQQDTAIQKGLQLTQTMLKAAGQVITSITAITGTSLAANEVVKNKTVGDMVQIASVAATPATLTATATSGGAAIAAVAAIIGAVGAIAGIATALAPIGASPEFISRLPPIDSQGHRLIGVKPSETVLDPTSTRAQAGLLRVAAETLRTRNAAASGAPARGGSFGEVNVYIGQEQLRPMVVEALDESGRFLGAA